MSVIRVKHTTKYVVINKTALEDSSLSFKAKGLWSYCMSRPDDWTFNVSHLATVSQDGEDAIYSALKELIKAGYCKRFQTNSGKGKGGGRGCFGSLDYEIYETPQDSNNFSQTENPEAESPRAGNPALLNKERYKGKKYKKSSSLPPPTKEEDEEIDLRIKERNKKTSEPIGNIKGYRKEVLLRLREEKKTQEEEASRADAHRASAKKYDMKKYKGFDVCALNDRVEFTQATFVRTVPYDLPDKEWFEQTGFE